jgi:very-short-patch-repair endonuclease
MKTNMHRRASTNLFGLAKKLRQNLTPAEEKLWERLRGNQTGYKFRRQHPMDFYVVDFYCFALLYVIEVDGGIHEDPLKKLEDENKDLDLEDKGYVVQRFSNDQVLNHIEDVMNEIYKTISFIEKKLREQQDINE